MSNALVNHKVRIIQLLWRYNNYSAKIVRNYLHFVVGGKPFEEIQVRVLERKLISDCYNFLKYMFKYIKLVYPSKHLNIVINAQTTKVYLVYLLLLYHSKQVIGETSNSELEKKLLYNVRILHTKRLFIQNDKLNKKKMYEYCLQFQNYYISFNNWKEDDAFNTIQNFAHNYWELELVTRQDFSNEEEGGVLIIEEVKKQQDNLLKYIEQIGGENGIKQFNEYVPIVYTESFVSNLRNTLEYAFWDMMRDELYDVPPKSDKLKSTLCEMQNLLLQLDKTPSFQDEINELLDVDFIVSMIINNAYDSKDLLKMVNYLGNQILRLDSPSNDDENCEIYEKTIDLILTVLTIKEYTQIQKISEGWIHIFKYTIPKFKEILELKNLILEKTK